VADLLEIACGAIGIAIFSLVIYAGLEGNQSTDRNFATVFVFVTFWVGLAAASALFGDLFRPFNPWRAIGRAVGSPISRYVNGPLRAEKAEPLLVYPAWLGRFPAVLGLFGFAYLELATDRTPRDVALAALVYSLFTFVGMGLFGVRRWCERGETFGTYFHLFSRLSPLDWRDSRLGVRRPLSGLTTLQPLAGTPLFLATMIGTVSFDGAGGSEAWQSLQRHIVDFLGGATDPKTALYIATGIGIVLLVVLSYGVYQLGIAGARRVGGRAAPAKLADVFAPSLVPIALAYVLAHYVTFLVVAGQSIAPVASDPLGTGANVLGTADWGTNESIVSAEAFWYMEVTFIIVGHALAVLVSHDLALRVYDRVADALRSQAWMVTVMIAFSMFALWLLSEGSELDFTRS
jgi:hypothetical protein